MVFRSVPSVRVRLSFLVAVCVLPLTLLVGWIVIDNFDRGRAQLIDSNVMVARTISSLVDREIFSTVATLNALTASRLLESEDWRAFHRQASEVAHKAGIASLILSDESGNEILNTLRPFGETLPRIGGERTLQLLRETSGPTISPLYFDPLWNEDVVAVSVPVRLDGRTPYILSAVLRPTLFAEILHQQGLPPDWIVAVVNGQNRFVARSHNMKEYVGKPIVPALADALAFDNEGSLESRTTEGVAVLGMFSRSATSNWAVAIGVPQSVLTADLHRRLLLFVSVLVAVLVASLALARSTAGKISG
ncbi:MAG: cache domain-containing protein, partial [Burkholderiaceae bacterium]